MADTVTISGFDKDAINGVYSYWKVVDGFDAFQKDSTHIVMYRPKLGGWSQTPSYYILENKQISGGIKRWIPIARSEGTSIASPTWITMKGVSSGEQTVGTTVYDEVSSSSSSIDSSSSSWGESSSSSSWGESSSSSWGESSSSSWGESSSSSWGESSSSS